MEQKLLEQLKRQLKENKKRLEAQLESFATKDPHVKHDWDTRYPRIPEGSIEEAADEVEEYESNVEIEHTLETQLRDVNEALERIERGSYGMCEKCAHAISEERLRAFPEGRLCANCNQ